MGVHSYHRPAGNANRSADAPPEVKMFTLEYADGYYIAKNGEGVIDFTDPEDYDFAEFVMLALNAAEHPLAQPTSGGYTVADEESKPAATGG